MSPRIPPLSDDGMTVEQKILISPYVTNGSAENVFRTMVQYPKLLKRWSPLIAHVLLKNSLPIRDREILILRTGFLCGAEYEWAQHVRIAREAGVGDAEISCIMAGMGLSAHEDCLLAAASELWRASTISDEIWQDLSKRYTQEQLMDVVMTVGQYTLVSMVLNSFGVELESGGGWYPPLPKREGKTG